jgi:hypothetical protein
MQTDPRTIFPYVAAMAIVVAASNYLVQYPFRHFGLDEILTWGAFTYPVAFLVNDLTNRRYGVNAARAAIGVGFLLAVYLSYWLATPRIAIASGSAFLVAQMLDASVFNALRRQSWWKAPFISTMFGSVIDTVVFFSLAFGPAFSAIDRYFGFDDGSLGRPATFLGADIPLWASLALGDFGVKMLIGLAMLIPYGLLLSLIRPAPANAA